MKKFFFRSVMVIGLALFSAGVTSAVDFTQFNRDAGTVASGIRSGIQSGGQALLDGVQGGPRVLGEGLDGLSEQINGRGTGFYMSIYKNVVNEPDEMLKEQLSNRFGLNFELSLQPQTLSGQETFAALYDAPANSYQPRYVPELENTLDQICARIRAGAIDEELRFWDLAHRRLKDQKIFTERPDPVSDQNQNEIDVAAVNRLIQSFPSVKEGFVQDLVKQIPTSQELLDQDTLFDCDREIRDAVDFEMRLQQLLHPQRKQLEVLQTFMNGKLEDFEGLPRYDLLLDIDVIESIFFGTGVTSGEVAQSSREKKEREEQALEVFRDITDSTVSELPDGGVRTGGGSLSFVRSLLDPFERAFVSQIPDQPSTLGFGKRSGQSAGPFCPDRAGLGLDFSTVGQTPASTGQSSQTLEELEASRAAEIIRRDGGDVDLDVPSGVRIAEPEQEDGELQEGQQSVVNSQSVCQGNSGFDFGNPLIRMVFCLTVEFKKVGKTWQVVSDDCISCHIAKMNQVFEEMLLTKSVRPHKNTGTVMESALCEDAYGNDVGFFSFIEWVPVKFYPDICYPQGGITNEDTARLTGYPEIVAKVSQPGNSYDCRTLEDDKAKERCQDALIFSDTIDSDQYDLAYVIRDELWKRLVGERGEAERELHEFLYRLGKTEPRHGEEEFLEQDLKQRKECLNQRIQLVQSNADLAVSGDTDKKTVELLKIKGYFEGESAAATVPEGCDAADTVSQLESDISAERDRVVREAARFNQAARDFNRKSACGPFSDPGFYDQFANFVDDQVLNGDYYLDTKFRATQTPQERVSGQILENTDVDDIDTLLNEIGQAVENNQESLREKRELESFAQRQAKSQVLPSALAQELTSLRTNLQSFTDWWSEMVDKKQFVNKSGKRINALESFLEKVRR